MCVTVDHEVDLKEQNRVSLVSLNHATGIKYTVTFLKRGYHFFVVSFLSFAMC